MVREYLYILKTMVIFYIGDFNLECEIESERRAPAKQVEMHHKQN